MSEETLQSLLLKATEEEAKQSQLRSSLTYGMGVNPDEQAKAQKVAGALGTTPSAVRQDMSYFEKAANANAFDYADFIKRAPRASNWLTNPDNASVAHDDLGILGNLEDVASQIAQIPQKAMGGVFRAMGGASMLAGTGAIGRAMFPFNPRAAEAAREVGTDVRNYYKPLFTDASLQPQGTAGEVAGFVGGIAGAMGKAIGSGPFAPLVFGAEAFGESAGSALERGASTGQAAVKATGSGAINALLGVIPGMKFGGEEALAEAIKRGAVPGIIAEASKGIGVRAARGTILGGVVTGGENLLDRVTGQPTKPWREGLGENIKTFIGMEFAGYLGHAIKATGESKLKKRSEAAFQSAMTDVFKDQPNLMVPADKLEILFQEKGTDPVSVAGEIQAKFGEEVAKRYLEAKATGTEIVLPTSEFLAKLTAEQSHQLLPDIRKGIGVPTLREAEAAIATGADEQARATLKASISEADKVSPEFVAVKNELVNRYTAAGESPKLAEDYATLQATVYSNLARESGLKPTELLKFYDPKIVSGEVPTTLEGGGQDVQGVRGIGGPDRPLSQSGVEPPGGQPSEVRGRVPEGTPDPLQFGRDQYEFVDLPEYRGNPELKGFNGDRNGVHLSFWDDASRLFVRPSGLEESKLYHPNAPSISLELSNKGDAVKVGVTGGDFKGYGITATDLMMKGLQAMREAWPDIKWVYGDLVGGEAIHAWRARFPSTRFGELARDSAPFRVGESFPFAPNPDELVHGIRPVVTSIDDILQGRRAPDSEYNQRLKDLGYQPRRPDVLLQPGEANPRGWFRVLPDGSFEIGKTKIGDLSTFIHEPAHSYLVMLGDLAKSKDASAILKQDHATALEFLGAKDGEALTRDQQETWARANEQFMREGKAPTPGLRGVFQRFAVWLGSVYRRASQLGVELTPEIRGVFERMYAGDRAIEEAQQAVDMKPLFADAKLMGVTQAEYDLYASRGAEAISTAHASILEQLNKDAARQQKAWWKEESAKLEKDVRAEVDADPNYQAAKVLRDGKLEDGTPIKLNRQALIDQFGEGVLKELPHGVRDYKGTGTMDAEAAAEILGFDSGAKLIDSLRNLEPRTARIARLTDERMKAKHGDLLTDGTLPDSGIEALHNKAREEMLYAELKALRAQERDLQPARDLQRKIDEAKSEEERKAAQDAWDAYRAEQKGKQKQAKAATEIPPQATFRTAAQERVSEMPPRDLEPYAYLMASRREAKKAFEAMAKDDFQTAADAKQRELLNHHLYLEATKAKAEAADIAEYGRNGDTPKFQGKLGKAGADFLEQWNALADRYEFRTVPFQTLDQRKIGLAEWAASQEKAGEAVAIDSALFRENPPKNWRETPMSELRAVRDALKNIETIARRQLKVMKGEETANFADAVTELSNTAYGNLKVKPLPLDPLARTKTDLAVQVAKSLNTGIVKFERVVDHLDQGDINGPWRRYLFEPMALAQFKEYELNQKVTVLLAEAMESMPKDQRHSLLDIIDVPEIGGKVTRKFILSMALNWGNASNREKMIKGMGWADQPEKAGAALKHLNQADWEFVQKTWDAIDTLWPEIASLQRRMTGIEPPRVEREAFEVALEDGTKLKMDGGYYPVVYDRTKSTAGEKQADMDIMGQEGGFNGPVTFKGHTKERIENFAAPLNMDFEHVLTQHVAKVIKDISHREAALSVSKLMHNQEVRQAVSETMGQPYTDMMLPWLKGTVNDVSGAMGPDAGAWKSMLMSTRSNMVLSGLAFRAGSIVVQATDFGRSLTRVDARHLGDAMLTFGRHPIQTTRMVRELSKEMAARSENLDRDTRSMLKRLQGQDGYMAQVQKMGMEGLAWADTITSVTTWLGAFNQAEAAGSPKEQAIREADRTVRLTMMSSAPKDMVAVQRVGDVGMKFLTMFMGDASASYGIMNEGVRNISMGKDVGRQVFKMAMVGMILPVVGQLIKNRGPRKDEDKAWWSTKAMLLSLPSSIPIARDIAQALETGADYKFSPIAGAIDKAVKAVRTAGAWSQGNKEWDDVFMQGFDAAGTLTGVPGTSQIMTSAKYMRDLKSGKQNTPDNSVDFWRNLVFGPPPKGR